MTLPFDIRVDGRVLEQFLMSPSRVNLIQGPWGSGKSRTCCYKLALNALSQAPGPNGIRETRYYIIRNTFDDLKRTTVATWLNVFPEHQFGRFLWSKPFEHHVRFNDVHMHAIFVAMDREEDARKLLSAEMSGLWLNEFRELSRRVLDDGDGRIERFPQGGPTFPMIIGDTNAPQEDHWFSVMSGQAPMPDSYDEEQRRAATKPKGWSIFIQPPGLLEVKDDEGEVIERRDNPEAENTKNLAKGYYRNMAEGKGEQWVRVNIMNRPGQLRSGKPVFAQFNDDVHVSRTNLDVLHGHVLHIGVDFGRTPAAVMGQHVFGRWRTLGELCARAMGARLFAGELKRYLAERFPNVKYACYGDPAGDNMDQGDETSPFRMFRAEGVPIVPAPSNVLSVRLGAVEKVLTEMLDGKPRFLLDPRCVTLKAGMGGGFHFRRLQVSGERYSDMPEKNQYSHPCDALQYMLMGGGEGRALLGQSAAGSGRPVIAKRPQGSVFQRRRA